MVDKKLLLGPKVRRLRRDQRLTQAQMAADLDISPAYLNLIEHNQRPVSAQVLVKIAAAYDIDLPAFAKDDAPEQSAKLREVFAAPSLKHLGLGAQDFQDMTTLSPEATEAILHLAQAAQNRAAEAGPSKFREERRPGTEMQQFFDARAPYFADLEELAETLRADMNLRQADLAEALDAPLKALCPFTIQVFPARIMGTTLRRYDMHGRRLLLNRLLPSGSRRFQTLMQYILNQHGPLLDRLVRDQEWRFEAAQAASRIQLAAYAAAAVLMPYDLFFEAAQQVAYDLEALALEFDVTREQAAHRLTSLRQGDPPGPAFFMARFDGAGRRTKTVGFQGFSAATAGDSQIQEMAGEATRSLGMRCGQVRLTDGEDMVLIAFTRQKSSLGFQEPGPVSTLVLGCRATEAGQTIYGQALARATEQTSSKGRLSWHVEPRATEPDDMVADPHRRDMRPFDFL